MALKVVPITSTSDLRALTRAHLSAFQNDGLYGTIYYNGLTPTMLEFIESRHRNIFTNESTVQYIKVVDVAAGHDQSSDAADGEIIAFAKYQTYSSDGTLDERKDASDRSFPDEVNLALAKHYWPKIQAARREFAMNLGPHILLDTLATAPSHNGRGAGSLLLQHISAMADDLDPPLPIMLESSPVAVRLYRKFGFERLRTQPEQEGTSANGNKVVWVDLEDPKFSLKPNGAGGKVPESEDDARLLSFRPGRTPGVGNGWYEHPIMIRPAKGKTLADYGIE